MSQYSHVLSGIGPAVRVLRCRAGHRVRVPSSGVPLVSWGSTGSSPRSISDIDRPGCHGSFAACLIFYLRKVFPYVFLDALAPLAPNLLRRPARVWRPRPAPVTTTTLP